MAHPRFQFFPGSRLPSQHDSSGVGVGWRLLGANNRELGRSATSFPDAESALLAIERMRTQVSRVEVHVLHDPRTGVWVWRLDDDGVPAATSGRGFRLERECRYNLDQFREAAPTAPTSDAAIPSEFPWQRTALAHTQPEAT